MTTRLTSRQFNQDTGGAKRAAQSGPVYITDRGRPSHVLLTYEEFNRLAAHQPSMGELLSRPVGIEDIEFEVAPQRDVAEPPRFD
jgi:prevent-host-death family protein